MNADNFYIDSAKKVLKNVLEEYKLKVSIPQIQNLMKQDLGMRYKKIKKISLHGNSSNNLILRQRFGIKLLSLTQKKTIFINMDESILDISDYRRMKWRPKYTTNSKPII